ncbi:MAG: damage-inducible protein DinB [Chloroflexi bacterium]|nr:damage-inducible protein DinB [Chloroflexota bacterium]
MDATGVEFFKHNTWANLRLLDACIELSEPQLDASAQGTYGSIRDTLFHLVGSEEGYVARLTGEALENPLRRGDPFPGVADLRERALRSGEALTAAAARLSPDTVLEGIWRGELYAIPVAIVLLQVINHGTEHRAQVAAILTQQSVTPPAIDAWTYREVTVGS